MKRNNLKNLEVWYFIKVKTFEPEKCVLRREEHEYEILGLETCKRDLSLQ